MLKWKYERRTKLGLVALALAFAVAAPAAGETLYSWRTDEGTFAFTDDAKRIPPRYRAQVDKRPMRHLRDYPRFTPAQSARSAQHAEATLERLTALRRVALEKPGHSAPTPVSHTLSLRTGGPDSPTLELRSGSGLGPVVVEELQTRPSGKVRTRRSVVVRQGDETLAIVKPRLREWNVTSDIHDEDELLR